MRTIFKQYQTSSFRIVKPIAAVLAMSGLLTACISPMQMKVPADIGQSSEVIPATERSAWSGSMADETFTLGAYKVVSVDRGWDSTSSNTVSVASLDLSSGESKGSYTYEFKTPKSLLQGSCETTTSQSSVGSAGLSLLEKTTKLNCSCVGNGKTVAKVKMKSEGNENLAGKLITGGKDYKVSSISEYSGMGASGYRIDGDSPLGAVEVLKPGRIWLGNDLAQTERSALACNFAGLMLYMPSDQ